MFKMRPYRLPGDLSCGVVKYISPNGDASWKRGALPRAEENGGGVKKPLTAQEALEKFGYLVCGSDRPEKCGPRRTTNHGVLPEETLLVVIGEVTREEASTFWREAGWRDLTYDDRVTHFCKAVAE